MRNTDEIYADFKKVLAEIQADCLDLETAKHPGDTRMLGVDRMIGRLLGEAYIDGPTEEIFDEAGELLVARALPLPPAERAVNEAALAALKILSPSFPS